MSTNDPSHPQLPAARALLAALRAVEQDAQALVNTLPQDDYTYDARTIPFRLRNVIAHTEALARRLGKEPA